MYRPEIVVLLILSAAACGRDGAGTESAERASDPAAAIMAVGGVRGTVRDASTDEPVGGAQVSAGGLAALTDQNGAYGVAPLPPGSLSLWAYQRGFLPESVTSIVEPGVSTLIDFPLVPAEPPCCELDGLWAGVFVLDSAGLNARPDVRTVSGELVFDQLMAEAPTDKHVHRAAGMSRVDFGSMLGSQGSNGDEAEGVVFRGDSVAITVVPRFADWGVEMLGRQSSDTIRGIWYQRASCCGAYGTFTLIRTAGAE